MRAIEETKYVCFTTFDSFSTLHVISYPSESTISVFHGTRLLKPKLGFGLGGPTLRFLAEPSNPQSSWTI